MTAGLTSPWRPSELRAGRHQALVLPGALAMAREGVSVALDDVVESGPDGRQGDRPDSVWASTTPGGSNHGDPNPSLDTILDQWRALERERDRLVAEDPRRAALEKVIARMRKLYQAETRRRQQDGPGSG